MLGKVEKETNKSSNKELQVISWNTNIFKWRDYNGIMCDIFLNNHASAALLLGDFREQFKRIALENRIGEKIT